MDGAILSFFSGHEGVLPLYAAWEKALAEQIGNVQIKVHKTQISFCRKRLFACVSFLPARRAKERPQHFLTVTFGLPERMESPRIDAAVEVSPHRWTHHVLIGRPEEINEELMAWIREAAAFAERK